MQHQSPHTHFTAALDALIAEIKQDRSILAALLCGSLAHDTVWARSDIDLVLITIDDKKVDAGGKALYADGVNVHALLMPRTQFRQTVAGSLTGSFMQSFLAKGRLLYSHDPSIDELCTRLQDRGARDITLQLLRSATEALACIYKAHKWFLTRQDLEYTALWILYSLHGLAQIELLERGQLLDREVMPQALVVNPAFFRPVYVDLLNTRKTQDEVRRALQVVDGYIIERTDKLFAPIFEHLREAGEVRSASEIEAHFERNCGISGVTTACEYLADRGLIGKAATTVQLTRRSNTAVQELAFYSLSR
jgi:uncharacterized protein